MTAESTRCAFAVAFALLSQFAPAEAQPTPQPWIEPQDTTATLFESDRYAWRVFVAMNWPANVAQKAPDTSKAFGADGPVVWETWRSVFPFAPDTVFPPNGGDPGEWLGGPAVVASRDARSIEREPRQQRIFAAQQAAFAAARRGGPTPSFEAGVSDLFGNEVRLNKAAYDFIRANKLHSRQGLAAAWATGQPILNFPRMAKAVKAQWRIIPETDKPRYHWAEFTNEAGQKRVYGLTAMHITTKDIPNWLWATFEHIDNKHARPARPGQGDEPPNEGWRIPAVDRAACPTPPHDCEGIPTGLGLEGTKWANYRLRGTQVDFVNSVGRPTILSNSQIERSFQRSSCIRCHADAMVDKEGRAVIQFENFAVGIPNPEKFRDPATGERVMQLDFLYSLQRVSADDP